MLFLYIYWLRKATAASESPIDIFPLSAFPCIVTLDFSCCCLVLDVVIVQCIGN